MGKKYIPVKINQADYRIYLDNVEKVYKVNKKKHTFHPYFCQENAISQSQHTN